ncbi:MAG TPA: hypothetical protein VGV93_01755 [Acidimicrobiales bacterium]|nr:hypothetical protein [Acidimicrobiales bacterium]
MAVDVEPAPRSSGAHHDTPDGGRPVPPVARRRWSPRRILLIVALMAALLAVLLLTGGADEGPTAENRSAEDAVPPPAGMLEDGFVVFTDAETGITLQHPESWVPLARPEGTRRLLLTPGGDSSVSVRVEPIEGTVETPEQLVEIQAVTDRIAAAEGVQVVKREPVEINGMLGISYLSRFTDEASGTKVANAQYFLFQGNTMYILLFQAAPEEQFDRLAPQFNRVLASFRAPPPAPGAEAPVPTAAEK